MNDPIDERIAEERRRLHLRPWEIAPSEVDDGPNPYPVRSAGHSAWILAQQWRAEIRERDPSYFDDDQ
jgi:hypothetical protein